MTINATGGNDVITVTEHDGIITVSGLGQDINITDAGAGDRIVINGLDGDDVITASGLHGGIQLVANGGNGDDVLIGSPGNDTLAGGAGDDVLIGGGGQDILDGGPGNNVVSRAAERIAAAMLLNQAMAASSSRQVTGHGEMPLPDPHAAQSQMLARRSTPEAGCIGPENAHDDERGLAPIRGSMRC